MQLVRETGKPLFLEAVTGSGQVSAPSTESFHETVPYIVKNNATCSAHKHSNVPCNEKVQIGENDIPNPILYVLYSKNMC